jgi:hypothetical protein
MVRLDEDEGLSLPVDSVLAKPLGVVGSGNRS